MPSVVGLLVLLVAGDCYMILPAFVMSLTSCGMNSGQLVSALMVPKHLDKMHSITLVICILQQLTKLQSFFVICTAKKYAVLSTTYAKKKRDPK